MGTVVNVIATVLYYLFLLFFFSMWGRFAVDLVRTFSRSWRPRGFGLVLAETAYTVTDPPIRFFRRVLPPLRLGPVAIDFGWSLTMLVCIVCLSITFGFRGL